MNKQEFLAALDGFDDKRRDLKVEFARKALDLENSYDELLNSYAREHAEYKIGEVVAVLCGNEVMIDTIADIHVKVMENAERTICFNYVRTVNFGCRVHNYTDKMYLTKIDEDMQQQFREEALAQALCKEGDLVMYLRTKCRVKEIYVRSYEGKIYPVYHVKSLSKSGWDTFASTRDWKLGNVQKIEEEPQC